MQDEMNLQDRLNHVLGTYIAVGVNDPQKYPEKPISSTDISNKSSGFTSDESLDAYICSLANNVKG